MPNIRLDEDVKDLVDFRAQALAEIFGEEEAKKLLEPEDSDEEFFDENDDFVQ